MPERPKASKKPKAVAKPPVKPAKKEAQAKDAAPVVQDPDFMFKTGFLADVYKERPVSDEIPRILTRMPPEPNVSNIL